MFYQLTVTSRDHGSKKANNISRDDVLQKFAVPFRLKRSFYLDGREFRAQSITAFKVAFTQAKFDPSAVMKKLDGSSLGNFFLSAAAIGAELDDGEEVTGDILAEADQLIAAQGLQPELPTFPGDFEAGKVFVICSFDPSLDQNFEAIRDVCEKRKLKALRVDKEMSSAPIIERIQRHLREANFVIADLTQARPNVYYELGYYDALCEARRVDPAAHLLLVAQNVEADAHFDIRHRGIETYDNPYTLMKVVDAWLAGRR
ncbi:MAG: hypothetical protein WDO74_01655 [Pseudomonadota bacterium]